MERRPAPVTARLEVIVGSMFSGKSEELIRRVKRARIARLQVQVFKPSLDDRYGSTRVASHDGGAVEAEPVGTAAQLLARVAPGTQVVAIDEVQFFGFEVVPACEALVESGRRVVCAGLDMDFRGEPFGPVPELMARAEEVTKLAAICVRCGQPASRTQRLIGGRPAHYEDPVILVGAEEVYEARCRHCHQVPGRPARRLPVAFTSEAAAAAESPERGMGYA
ncbi:thymidine kinase [Limnochorda pilosa]|uniref:Thymidine kinase n=1 Tax=Limnochorda pilosa TaxID=1555112 RepID=A0A0K2SPA1_LIMPI|nr:thymidine kinase [Limnochorda pilosa]BAS28931.1 thymidine kinase [Limnochorda pilosa]